VSEADRVPQAELAAAAASLGLGVDQDLGAPAFLGSVPPDSTGTEHAASMIGQGRVEASPLAMATVAASVAAGETVVPRLVLEPQTAPEAEPEQPLSGAEAEQLAALMRGVVTDGSGSFLADVPGPPVGAKTGTAEYPRVDDRGPGRPRRRGHGGRRRVGLADGGPAAGGVPARGGTLSSA
jgi:cell division protein FtsI/penicillin-binding protein 2